MRNLQHQFKMNKSIILITAVVLGTMISCSPGQKESKQVTVQEQNQMPEALLKADTSATISLVSDTVQASETQKETAVVNTAANPPELNPAHGQPFHRCDIPVGSPLNSVAPAKSAQIKPATPVNKTGMAPTIENAARLNNQQVNNPASTSVATGTLPKLNPPHGQPFHRCDIPVGSALPVN
jgi:hypothetical protein